MGEAGRMVAVGGTGIVGVILAGGDSRRMGREKSLLLLDGTPLVARIANRLAPQVGRLAISANGDAGRFAFCGLPVLPDAVPDRGPLAGVLAGMRWARRNGDTHLLSVACDTPFFPADLAAALAAAVASDPGRVAVARSKGRDHLAFTLQPVSLAERLEDWLTHGPDRSIRGWLALLEVMPVAFEAEDDPFLNLNTPHDLARAEGRLRQS